MFRVLSHVNKKKSTEKKNYHYKQPMEYSQGK